MKDVELCLGAIADAMEGLQDAWHGWQELGPEQLGRLRARMADALARVGRSLEALGESLQPAGGEAPPGRHQNNCGGRQSDP